MCFCACVTCEFYSKALKACVILHQSLSAERESSRTPEMGMDPEEPQVFPVLRAQHASWRARFLPHWEDQVSPLLKKATGGI